MKTLLYLNPYIRYIRSRIQPDCQSHDDDGPRRGAFSGSGDLGADARIDRVARTDGDRRTGSTSQFSAPLSDLPDQPILASDGKSNNNLGPVQAAFFQNAVTGQDQLRQRVAFILSQIWVVSQVSVHPAYAFPPYWRIFRDNAFGNYRDIIKAVTLSPAMGTYLNMANNNKANAAKGTAANENYARELMQLFTLGLTELNPDGSPVLDANQNPVPTYDQSVVTNMAKVLTGWTYPTAPNATAKNQ